MYDGQPWYTQSPQAAADAVRLFASNIRTWRAAFLSKYNREAEMYERELWSAVYQSSTAVPDDNGQITWWRGDRVPSDNIVKALCNTLMARLFSEVPQLQVAALGGDYMARLQAERKTWALRSTLDTTEARQVLTDARLDGLKTGFGAVLPEVRGGSYMLTRVTLADLWFHPYEARDHRRPNDPPRNMHCMTRISKGQAIAMIDAMDPECLTGDRDAIIDDILAMPPPQMQGMSASNYSTPYDRFLSSTAGIADADLVGLLRSWHLPSTLDNIEESDGCELYQIVALNNAEPGDPGVAFFKGPWIHETHPVVWWTPYPVHQGIVGMGITTIAEPYQHQQDWTFSSADRLIKDWGIPNCAIPGDMDNDDDKTDIAGSQSVNFVTIPGMSSTGKFYELIQHNAQGPELLSWLERIPSMAYARTGINEGISMGGTRLSGNVSGAALNAEDTRADVRFADVLGESDAFEIAVGQETLNTLDRAMDADGDFVARFRDRWKDFHEVNWSELRMTSGAYEVKIEQLGALGRTAAARLRSIQELASTAPAMADAAIRATYIDHDLPSVAKEANADRRYVEWQLYYLALHATVEAKRAEKLAPYWPDEITDLDIAEAVSRHELQDAKRQGADEQVLAVLTEYRARVQKRREEELPPPPPPMAAGIPGIEPELPSMAEAPIGLDQMAPGVPIQ